MKDITERLRDKTVITTLAELEERGQQNGIRTSLFKTL